MTALDVKLNILAVLLNQKPLLYFMVSCTFLKIFRYFEFTLQTPFG